MLFTAGANDGRLFIVMDKAMHEPHEDFVKLKILEKTQDVWLVESRYRETLERDIRQAN